MLLFFYDLSSLDNFYSFSVDIIVLTLFGRFIHFPYFMLYAVFMQFFYLHFFYF